MKSNIFLTEVKERQRASFRGQTVFMNVCLFLNYYLFANGEYKYFHFFPLGDSNTHDYYGITSSQSDSSDGNVWFPSLRMASFPLKPNFLKNVYRIYLFFIFKMGLKPLESECNDTFTLNETDRRPLPNDELGKIANVIGTIGITRRI